MTEPFQFTLNGELYCCMKIGHSNTIAILKKSELSEPKNGTKYRLLKSFLVMRDAMSANTWMGPMDVELLELREPDKKNPGKLKLVGCQYPGRQALISRQAMVSEHHHVLCFFERFGVSSNIPRSAFPPRRWTGTAGDVRFALRVTRVEESGPNHRTFVPKSIMRCYSEGGHVGSGSDSGAGKSSEAQFISTTGVYSASGVSIRHCFRQAAAMSENYAHDSARRESDRHRFDVVLLDLQHALGTITIAAEACGGNTHKNFANAMQEVLVAGVIPAETAVIDRWDIQRGSAALRFGKNWVDDCLDKVIMLLFPRMFAQVNSEAQALRNFVELDHREGINRLTVLEAERRHWLRLMSQVKTQLPEPTVAAAATVAGPKDVAHPLVPEKEEKCVKASRGAAFVDPSDSDEDAAVAIAADGPN